jgi:hypothetical protein
MCSARYIFILVILFFFPTVSTAEIWELETTEVPQATYPLSLDPVDFEAILTTYNTYMTAFAESDFHTMADQMDFKSKSLTWSNRLDAIDNFSFIKDHILQDYDHSDAFGISFISPKVGGYVLFVQRIDKNVDGDRISSAWSFYEFQKTDTEWKISSITSLPSLRSPF